MRNRKMIYGFMLLPLILTGTALLFLPDQVAIHYSSSGVQYGSKFSLIIIPILGIWIGTFLLLVGKTVANTPQEETVRKITYIPLVIFNFVTIVALAGAFFIKAENANVEIIDIVAGSIIGIVAILLAVYAFFTSREKGPIISNPYVWLSEEERAKVDKKAEYRQLTVVFGCLALAFALLAIYMIFSWKWAFIMMWIVFAVVVVYAIVSSVRDMIRKSGGRYENQK